MTAILLIVIQLLSTLGQQAKPPCLSQQREKGKSIHTYRYVPSAQTTASAGKYVFRPA